MLEALMAFSALALAVLALVVLALLMSRVSALTRGLDYRIDQLSETMRKSAHPQVVAELDGLRAALDVTTRSNRREFGKLWARIGGERTETVAPNGAPAANDDTFAAMLALQGTPPVKPT